MIFRPCGYAWADDRTRMEGASPHHVCAERGEHEAHRCACGVIFGPDSDLRYSRDVLVDVLVYHQRTNTSGCHCGWGVLGASHAQHVADVYEESIRVYDEDAED